MRHYRSFCGWCAGCVRCKPSVLTWRTKGTRMSSGIDETEIQRSIDHWRSLPPLHRARALIARLFVDTEHDALDLVSIAEQLVETDFDPQLLDQIYRNDVAPVCASSALIGVWPDFDLDWLNEKIDSNSRTKPGWLAGIFRALRALRALRGGSATDSTEAQWSQIIAYVQSPKALAEAAKKLRA